jgi:hypothetical protein
VEATTGTIGLNSRLDLQQTAVEGLTLDGLAGDDTFTIDATHPYTAGILLSAAIRRRRPIGPRSTAQPARTPSR